MFVWKSVVRITALDVAIRGWQSEVSRVVFFSFRAGQKWPISRTGNSLSNRCQLDPFSGRSYTQGRKMPEFDRLAVQAELK